MKYLCMRLWAGLNLTSKLTKYLAFARHIWHIINITSCMLRTINVISIHNNEQKRYIFLFGVTLFRTYHSIRLRHPKCLRSIATVTLWTRYPPLYGFWFRHLHIYFFCHSRLRQQTFIIHCLDLQFVFLFLGLECSTRAAPASPFLILCLHRCCYVVNVSYLNNHDWRQPIKEAHPK